MSATSPSPTRLDRTIRVLDPVPEGIRILAVVVLLLIVGCFTLYSASSYRSLLEFGDPTHLWQQQLSKGYAIGLLSFVVGFFVPPRFWFEIGAIPMWIIVTGLLFASIYTPLGVRLNDANRWVELMNIRFQPAEMAKFTVPMTTIALTGLWRFRRSWWSPRQSSGGEMSNFQGAICVGMLVGVPFYLTFIQPDFGTSLFIFLLGMIPVFQWGKTIPYLFVPA
ncbi:MAG: FtsW/RodA/SpoVE family cell cycle protein, partial [Planctomycetota bacterium]